MLLSNSMHVQNELILERSFPVWSLGATLSYSHISLPFLCFQSSRADQESTIYCLVHEQRTRCSRIRWKSTLGARRILGRSGGLRLIVDVEPKSIQPKRGTAGASECRRVVMPSLPFGSYERKKVGVNRERKERNRTHAFLHTKRALQP